jgi:hypothetical protein
VVGEFGGQKINYMLISPELVVSVIWHTYYQKEKNSRVKPTNLKKKMCGCPTDEFFFGAVQLGSR